MSRSILGKLAVALASVALLVAVVAYTNVARGRDAEACGKGGEGMGKGHGGCALFAKGVQVSAKSRKDGVRLTFSSDDKETVARLQECGVRLAKGEGCCPMKKGPHGHGDSDKGHHGEGGGCPHSKGAEE